jgi:hypothetical protein
MRKPFSEYDKIADQDKSVSPENQIVASVQTYQKPVW